jgi:acylphosphatase
MSPGPAVGIGWLAGSPDAGAFRRMAMADDSGRLHARVHGLVQGVGFRAFVIRRAQALGLTGWVANLSGGGVEVVAEGPRPQLSQLLGDLQQGPRAAEVEQVEAEWLTPTSEFTQFRVRYV